MLLRNANNAAAANIPACLIPPPNNFRTRLHFLINSWDPMIALPTGAPSPLLKQTDMESKCFPYSCAVTPDAMIAFHMRAPSQ